MGSRSIKVGVDLDGVLARYDTAWQRLIQRILDIDIQFKTPAGPDQWHWDRAVLTDEQHDRVWGYVHTNPGWWRTLDPYPETQRALQTLAGLDNVETYFVTARPGDGRVKHHTESWLEARGYYRTPTVVRAESAGHKGLLASGLALDAFIDDAPDNVLAVRAACKDCWVVLRDQPYNQDVTDGTIERLPNVLEFANVIEKWAA